MRLTLILLFLLALSQPRRSGGAEFSGLLRDNQGHGLGGIAVSADIFSTLGATQVVATTEATGHFHLAGESGYWVLAVSAADLNARGYFSVSPTTLDVTDQATARLTTRRLDFTHRLLGRLLDEAGQPLAGCALRARLWENNARFETNLVTAPNGAFTLAAVPAVWSLDLAEPGSGRVFGEHLVELEVAQEEKQVAFVAPLATATISITTSHLGGYDVVVSGQAGGVACRLTQTVPLAVTSVLDFRVTDGVWTIQVTNASLSRGLRTAAGVPPDPVSVAITNEVLAVVLNGVIPPSPPTSVQRVRTLTTGGLVLSNATVSASSTSSGQWVGGLGFSSLGTPGVTDLALGTGRWRLSASLASSPDWMGWTVSYEVVIASNLVPAEVVLVFPEAESGPRISGTIRTPDGTGLAARSVSVGLSDGGTNYRTSALTDSLGHFEFHVIPGRWQVATSTGGGTLSSVVGVSNQDAQVDFEVLTPVSGPPALVDVSLTDEEGELVPDPYLSLQSGLDFVTSNGSANVVTTLRPGLWHASVQQVGAADSYVLCPSLTYPVASGEVTEVVLGARRAPARIEGRLRDEQGRLLLSGYASAWTSVNGTNFLSYGSIASGYFSLNVFPGDWQVGASVSGYAPVGLAENTTLAMPGRPGGVQPATHYTTPSGRWVRVSNDLVRCDFVTTNLSLPPSIALDVTVVGEDGRPIGGLVVGVQSLFGGQTLPAGEDGRGAFAVPPGRVTLSARRATEDFSEETLLFPTLAFDLSAPSNQVVLVVRRPTANLRGTVVNGPALGLQPQIVATTQIGGTNYTVTGCADSTGHYCLPLCPGPWAVGIADDSLNPYGLQSVAQRRIILPPTGQWPPVDFVLSPIAGDFREARFPGPVLWPDGTLQLELGGVAGLTWRVDQSDNLTDWQPLTLGQVVNGVYLLQRPVAPSSRAGFYRAVWVR